MGNTMPLLILLALTAGQLSLAADINPELREWYQLKTDHEYHHFPLNDWILEIKTVEKFTTRRLELFEGGDRVGQLGWNAISKNLYIAECDVRYEPYRTTPADDKHEQIWALNKMKNKVKFSCDNTLQYEQYWDEGDGPRWSPPGFPVIEADPPKCLALGAAKITKILFRFMEGQFIRAVPKQVVVTDPPVETTVPPTEPTDPPTTDPFGLMVMQEITDTPVETTTQTPTTDDAPGPDVQPICNCWTAECEYCKSPDCHVGHDLSKGVVVNVQLRKEVLANIMLLDGAGNAIGTFSWNKNAISLTGMLDTSCRAPRVFAKLAKRNTRWLFKLENRVISLQSGDDIVYSHKLKGSCAEKYSKVKGFAFYDMSCESSFVVEGTGMIPGALVDSDCGGACSL